MKSFNISVNGQVRKVAADKFQQAGDYVAFYSGGQCTGLVKFNAGDSVFELLDEVLLTKCSGPGE